MTTNLKIKRWLRFWVWVDLIGLILASFLTISYLIWADNFSEHIQNLWSNLAVEIFGVWISVRIIDFLIQRHKNFKQTRFKQLGNFAYFDDIANHILRYSPSFKRDIIKLELEITYFEKRWDRKQKHFYKDEKEQILCLSEKMKTILIICKELESIGDKYFEIPLKEKYDNLKIQLSSELTIFRQELELLRENIWEETHPDD